MSHYDGRHSQQMPLIYSSPEKQQQQRMPYQQLHQQQQQGRLDGRGGDARMFAGADYGRNQPHQQQMMQPLQPQQLRFFSFLSRFLLKVKIKHEACKIILQFITV
jgi:hypothetical protein